MSKRALPADVAGAAPPAAPATHDPSRRSTGGSGATMLTVYVVLLVGVPSNLTITGLGGLGRPSLIWGLFLLLWWMLALLQKRESDAAPVAQPVRVLFGAVVVVVLVSFAAAMLRGQPADQVSPALTALVRLASWAGVLMVAMDGVRTAADLVRVVRALAIAGGAMAALGLVQFVTGLTLLDWLSSVPGVTLESTGVSTRGAFTRASGTAIHPLEYGTVVVATLPLAISAAISGGFRPAGGAGRLRWWLPVVFITIASLIAVSRSAIVGLVVALAASLPAVPKGSRWLVGVGGMVLALGVIAFVPGMLGTVVGLFAGASDDPSTQSRTDALARVPEFIASSPVIGQGFGTFLPRYYIFDNQWVLFIVEIGILGLVLIVSLVVAAIGSAVGASRRSPFSDTRLMGLALAATMLTIAVLFLFFDGLSFPISAGMFFLIVGLCASVRRVGEADALVDLGQEAGLSARLRPRSESTA